MPLLFIFYPFAEFYAWYLFIDKYSFLDAMMFVISTGIVGFIIMTMQGRATVMSMQQSLALGKVPEFSLLHRTATLIGGLLFVVPGLIAKALGLLLILPGTRHLLVFLFRWFLAGKIASGAIRVFAANSFAGGGFSAGFGRRASGPNNATNEFRDVVEVKPKSVQHEDKKINH